MVNPHDFELETVCASVHAPHLVHTHDTAQGSSMSMVCASLGPNESRIVSFRLYAPEDSVVDSHTIVAKVMLSIRVYTALLFLCFPNSLPLRRIGSICSG